MGTEVGLIGGGLLLAVLTAVGKFARDFINRQQTYVENHAQHQTAALAELKNVVQDNTSVSRDILRWLKAHDD